jgi:hypothetical protein
MSAHRSLALLAVLATGAVACGGSDKSTGPSNNGNNQQVVTQLTQLSTRLSGTPAGGFVGFAIGGLSLGVQPSTINVTTDLSRRGPVAEGVSLSTRAAGPMQGVAFRVVMQNYPGMTGDFLMNGGVMWTADLNDFVVVIGSNSTGSFGDFTDMEDFAIGGLFTVSPQATWFATNGSMSVTGGPTGSGGSACPGTIEGYACRVGTFTLGYNIAASEPAGFSGDAATGSRSASLSSASINGYTITVDYDELSSGSRAMYDQMVRMAR